MTLKKKIMLP